MDILTTDYNLDNFQPYTLVAKKQVHVFMIFARRDEITHHDIFSQAIQSMY